MKTLIMYFTRTNTTKILAEAIAKKTGAEIEVINDKRDWSGVFGYLGGGRAALKKELSEIEELQSRIEDYDLLILGMPVWVGTMPPAIRTFVTSNKEKIKKIAFFTTQGGAQKQRIFSDLKELSGLEPVAEFFCTTKSIRANNYEAGLNDFVAKINAE